MLMRFRSLVGGGGMAAALALSTAATPVRRHTQLVKSQPAAHDTLTTAPTQLSLWYSERLELRVSTFKLVGPKGAVALGPATNDVKQKSAPILIPITGAIEHGRYDVQWNVSADDGHPVKGTFFFVVK